MSTTILVTAASCGKTGDGMEHYTATSDENLCGYGEDDDYNEHGCEYGIAADVYRGGDDSDELDGEDPVHCP